MTFRPHVPLPKPLPTVKIAAPGSESGYVIINERDFNPAEHKKYDERAAGRGPRKSSAD